MTHEEYFKVGGGGEGICPGGYMSGGRGRYVQGVSVQGVSVQGVSDRGVCVLGVSVRGVHVRGGGVFCPVLHKHFLHWQSSHQIHMNRPCSREAIYVNCSRRVFQFVP